jgi:hypothetical protein
MGVNVNPKISDKTTLKLFKINQGVNDSGLKSREQEVEF